MFGPTDYDQLRTGFNAVRRTDRYWAGLSTDLAIEQVMMRSIKSRGGLTHGRGMTESIRLMWVQSMHKCGTVLNAVERLSNLEHQIDDTHHVDLGKSRILRDVTDLKKIIDWFRSRNPFTVADVRLHSLSTGIAATEADNINCDSAEEVGAKIMGKMNNVAFCEVTLKKADQARTLAHITSKRTQGEKTFNIDGTVLFSRLLIVMQRSSDLEQYFKYELTAQPTALFMNTCLRKSDKSVLAKELKKAIRKDFNQEPKTYVLDGGWLLHKVKWQSHVSYAAIVQQYRQFVAAHFGSQVTIVFDGYCNGPTTKDHEHGRRSLKAAPDVVFDDSKPAYSNQSAYLANEGNKKALVDAIVHELQNAGFQVFQALNDADTLIAHTALQIALSHVPVTVVANDTDVLVLLVYHFKHYMADIVMKSEVSKRGYSSAELIPIRTLCTSIGSASQQILVIHAISGCDTTSSLYGQGKSSIWKAITRNNSTLAWMLVLDSPEASRNDVVSAGLKLMTLIIGGKSTDCLNHLRYGMYMAKTASYSAQPRPERLPPTENAAIYHIYHVHLQVVQWNTFMKTDLKPEDWGWRTIDGRYEPIMTDLEAVPEELLSVVRCKCKADGRRPCSTQLCSCIKNGLSCVAACKNCNGEQCQNVSKPNLDITAHNQLVDLIPEDCIEFDIPWLDEEEVGQVVMIIMVNLDLTYGLCED